MKLDDFVAETLKQVMKGVASAKEYGGKNGAEVNPITARLTSGMDGISCVNTGELIHKIVFDVAVTTSEDQTTKDSDTTVGSITVSPNDSQNVHNSSVSRIQFDVFVKFPTTGNKRYES